MAGWLGIGIAVMIVADAVVGGRLVWLSARTRRLPELALGLSVFLLGGVGYPLAIAARQGLGGADGASAVLGAALALQNVGALAMAVSVWRTFRADAPAAPLACAGFAAALLASWILQATGGGFGLSPGATAAYWLGLSARATPFAWSAFESWRYFLLLRRRLALGLAEPAVADRFMLWAVCATSVTVAFALFAVAVVAGLDVATSPWVLAPTSAAGLVSGVTLWLAFLAPRWYRRRFEETVAA